MSEFIKKIFKNQEIEDLPFPEISPHTHDGENSPFLAPKTIDKTHIKTGAVGELALEDGAVTKLKIADEAVWTQHLQALAVTEDKLADASVEWDKIANEAVRAAHIWTGGAVITLAAQIQNAVIESAHIGNAQILNAHLGNAIVTTAKIYNLAVTTAKIDDLAVEWAKIGDLAVGNSKIMNLAVSTGKIQDLAVQTAKINDLAVLWGKIGNLEVGRSKIMLAAIGTAQIDDLAVTNAKINDLSAVKINTGILTGIIIRTQPEGNQRVEMDATYHSFLSVDASAIVRCQITHTGKIIQRDSNANAGELWQGADYNSVDGHSVGGMEIYEHTAVDAQAEIMLADLGQTGLRQGAVYVGGAHFAPMVNNAMDCGSPSYQWNDVYCYFIRFPSAGGRIIWNGGVDMDWYADRIDFGKTIAPYVVNCDLGRSTAYWKRLYVDEIINPDFIDFAVQAAAPAAPGAGTFYFNQDGNLYIWDGANWRQIAYV